MLKKNWGSVPIGILIYFVLGLSLGVLQISTIISIWVRILLAIVWVLVLRMISIHYIKMEIIIFKHFKLINLLILTSIVSYLAIAILF